MREAIRLLLLANTLIKRSNLLRTAAPNYDVFTPTRACSFSLMLLAKTWATCTLCLQLAHLLYALHIEGDCESKVVYTYMQTTDFSLQLEKSVGLQAISKQRPWLTFGELQYLKDNLTSLVWPTSNPVFFYHFTSISVCICFQGGIDHSLDCIMIKTLSEI